MSSNTTDQRSTPAQRAPKPDRQGAETNTEYANGLVPLLWLGIPFILVMLYGIFC